jgi:hypothetical protein
MQLILGGTAGEISSSKINVLEYSLKLSCYMTGGGMKTLLY